MSELEFLEDSMDIRLGENSTGVKYNMKKEMKAVDTSDEDPANHTPAENYTKTGQLDHVCDGCSQEVQDARALYLAHMKTVGKAHAIANGETLSNP